MTTLLQINASLNSHDGQSSQLADQFVAAFRARHPDAKVRAARRRRGRTRTAPQRRALWRIHRQARRAERRAARRGGVFRRTDRRAQASRRHRARPADVQLRRAVAIEGLLRSHRACGRDLQVHRQGPGGTTDGQESLRVRGPRRSLCRARRWTRKRAMCAISCDSSASPTWNSSMLKVSRSAPRASRRVSRRPRPKSPASPPEDYGRINV